MYCIATVGCEHERPPDPKMPISGIGPLVTLVAGRSSLSFSALSPTRTPSQSRAQIASSRARDPHTDRCESSPMTVLRPATLQVERMRCLDAYAARQLAAQHSAQLPPPNEIGPYALARQHPLPRTWTESATHRRWNTVSITLPTDLQRTNGQRGNACLRESKSRTLPP